MKRGLILGALVGVAALSTAVGAALHERGAPPGGQQGPSAAAIRVDKIRDNLYMLRGGGGNTAVKPRYNPGTPSKERTCPSLM